MDGHEPLFHPAPWLLTAIIDRDDSGRLEDILREKRVHFHYMFHAMGAASSESLKTFGLSGTEKTVCLCIVPDVRAEALLTAVKERLALTRPGNGIAFIMPVSGVSAGISHTLAKEYTEHEKGQGKNMERETINGSPEPGHELVIALVNQGFSEQVMDAAHKAGARGGTIVNARRTGLEDAVKFFGISLQAEKEIVAILIPRQQKKELMQAISSACGMKTQAHGIVFSLPVEACAGLSE